MTTPLSVTKAERIAAQSESYRKALKGFAWGRAPESLFLMPPQMMEDMFRELEERGSLLERIRAHFQHGADESLWPRGTPLDDAVGRLVSKVYGPKSTPMTSDKV